MINEHMKQFFEHFKFEGMTFDDVLLIPGQSEVVPIDVNLETRLSTNISLNIPLVSADMNTVTEVQMARAMAMQGGLGFLWKGPINEQEKWVANVKYTLNKLIKDPITVNENQTLADANQILSKYDNKFSTLVVLDNGHKVVGLLTKDKSQFGDKNDFIKDLMVVNPFTSEEDLNVNEAYVLMRKKKVPKLILVTQENELKGMYTFQDVKEIVEGINPMHNRDSQGQLRVGANVGVCIPGRNEKAFYERVEGLLRKNCDILLVGTAHGHSKNVINTVKELKNNFKNYNFDVAAGNVATYEGAVDLFKAGADVVKVGVGPGSICTTRIVSGAGRAQMNAIYEAAKAGEEYGKPIIADGGIRYSGDITKALSAGASCIMAGSLFAGTNESPGLVKEDGNGRKYKEYIGMGSLEAMSLSEDAGERYKQEGVSKEKLVPEGVAGRVPYKGPVNDIIRQQVGGLQSGMGYVGAENITELQKRARFDKITLAGQKESHPHDVEIKSSPNYSK
jgi:IMP dehydrogenase